MSPKQNVYKVGIVGAGFIADYHFQAIKQIPNTHLSAICDTDLSRAQAFARAHGIAHSYNSLESMLDNQKLDVVHTLVPPDHHFRVAQAALDAGAHLFLEKPMCTNHRDCQRLVDRATKNKRTLGVNHNFLFYPVCEQLKKDLQQGTLGLPHEITIDWNLELSTVTSGPFDSWMLRDPANIILEIGSHSVAHMLHLVGPPDEVTARAMDPVELPGHRRFYRRWHVLAQCGRTAVELRFAFMPGFPERTIHVRGSLGTATVDFGHNTYTIQRYSKYQQDFDCYHRLIHRAGRLRRQARSNLFNYVLSKCHLSKRGNAFAYSIARSVQTFYAGLHYSPDPRQAPQLGIDVIRECTRIVEQAHIAHPEPPAEPPIRSSVTTMPNVLVLGGTGFIGRQLVHQLLEANYSVRIMTRNAGNLPFDANHPRLHVCQGSMLNDADLERAMEGITYVFHLARARAQTWHGYYEHDVLATQRVARCCLKHRIKRLIYTGTIASYYTGCKAGIITEDTPLDTKIERRDHYSRAKAMSEAILLKMHQEENLPVVIFRPGIVIGKGGSPYHWGVGKWTAGGVCQLWGDGHHELPFVLVEDVAKALIAGMDTADIEGETFNLASKTQLSARDYLTEIEKYSRTRLQVIQTSIWRFYAADMLKWIVKVLVKHPNRRRPTFRDWESRTTKAVFDCSKAKAILGWQPVENKTNIITQGIHLPIDEVLA